MTKKKVLIMSASIGSGHTQAARAIEAYLRTVPEECDVEHVDFISNDVLSFDNFVKETYLRILDVFPMLYDMMYYSSQGNKKGSVVKAFLSWGLKRRMMHIINEVKPDMLVLTHPFAAGAAALLKRQHRIDIPLVCVLTDFTIHQLWVYQQIDQYFVAASQLKDSLIAQGVDAEKVIVSGIPVRSSFLEKRWHWDESHQQDKNILIMGGGLGLGSIQESLRVLDRLDCVDTFTVVTGHNADLFDELMKERTSMRHPVEVYGYTNHIPELMQKAAFLLTKPGALTCTEAAAIQVPMVLFSPIPGQEEGNAIYLQKKGCASWVKDQKSLVALSRELLQDPEKLVTMSQASLACHRNGAYIIGTKLLQLLYPEKQQTALQGSACSHVLI